MTSGTTLVDHSYDSLGTRAIYTGFPPVYSYSYTEAVRFSRSESKTWGGPNRTLPGSEQPLYYSYRVTKAVWRGRGKNRHLVDVSVLRKVRIKAPSKSSRFDVPHAYNMQKEVRYFNPITMGLFDYTGGSVTTRRQYYGYPWDFFAGGTPFSDLSLDANDQIKLVNKLSDAIRGSDFNPAVFLAEGHEALTMIARNATTIAESIRLLRKGQWDRAIGNIVSNGGRRMTSSQRKKLRSYAGHARDNASQRWLEAQYGWLPLLSDMKSGAEYLSHYLHAPFHKRVYASVKKVGNLNRQAPWRFAGGTNVINRNIVAYLSENPSSVASLTGLLDPELVIWELLPYSFVADWAIPIGDWLSARACSGKLNGTFVTTDLLRRTHKGLAPQTVFNPGPNQTVWNVSSGAGGDNYRFITMNRSISTSLNVPLPKFKSLESVASWKHCANAVALLVGAFK